MQINKNALDIWKDDSLGNLISLEYGKSLTESNRKVGRYPVFGSNGIIGYHDQHLIEGPGIMIGRKGSIGEVIWVDDNFWPIDTTYFVKKKKEELSLKWLYYFLNWMNLKNLNSATGIPGLNRNDVYKLSFPIPPIQEQQKIASILSNVDNLIQKTDQIIEQTQRLKKGLVDKLLVKGISHKEYRQIALSNLDLNIPKEWKVEPLSNISDVIDVRHTTPKYTTTGIPLILPNNVKLGGLNFENTKFTSYDDYLYMIGGNREPKKNDIVYSRNASFGIACLIEKEEKFSLGQDLVLIKPTKINPFLLYTILNSNYVTFQVNRLMTGSTFLRINLNLIRNFTIIYPNTHEEQQKIASILSNIDNLIQKLKGKKKNEEILKKGLMQQLLTGKIRVRV